MSLSPSTSCRRSQRAQSMRHINYNEENEMDKAKLPFTDVKTTKMSSPIPNPSTTDDDDVIIIDPPSPSSSPAAAPPRAAPPAIKKERLLCLRREDNVHIIPREINLAALREDDFMIMQATVPEDNHSTYRTFYLINNMKVSRPLYEHLYNKTMNSLRNWVRAGRARSV
jgi:hypothetical protein